jgi:UDP-N-acetylmuramoylalanine--D-glutamate ligase
VPGSDHDVLRAAGRVAVYGLGREGRSIVRYVRRVAPTARVEVLIDDTADAPTKQHATDLGVSLVQGRDRVVEHLASGAVDVVVRSPGVPLRGPGVSAAREHHVPVTTGTNLWFEAQAPDNVVAVTGTKGKSTTSSLLAHLLAASGRDVALLGNIGAPVLDHPHDAREHDVVVVELSSYQLADLHQRLPVGVWLNLHHEHLDWHGSHAAYAADKGRIVELSDILVANAADADVAAAATGHPDVRWVDAAGDPVAVGPTSLPREQLVAALDASRLVGHHHVANLAAVLAAAEAVGAEATALLPHVATYDPLPHRLELVHDDGRRWVDDSISTIPEAAVAALRAFPDQPVTLLAGGYDRAQDHAPLVDEVARRDDVAVVVLPDTGDRLAAELAARGHEARTARDLADAVAIADASTPDGGVVLLSPAAPSYGHFTSFEERGDRFAALARVHDRRRADG